MQPSFLIKHLSHQSLAVVICYYMVYLRSWLNTYNVCRTQLLVLLFRPSFVILHLFLQIFPGSRLIFGLTLKYLSLPTILSMDLLLLIFKIFFKVISRHGILGLQRKIYFPRLHLTWTVIAVVFLLLLRLDLWNSLPHHIRDAGWGSEWGDPLVGCRLKFRYFVGSRLQFSIFVVSRLNSLIFVGCRKISVNK